MPTKVMLSGDMNDKEFFEYLEEQYPDSEVSTAERFDGIAELTQIVLIMKPVMVPVIIAYLVGRGGRSVTIDGKKMVFKGYNLKDIQNALDKCRD